jgi:tellurite resistance-related uncharacterized protein
MRRWLVGTLCGTVVLGIAGTSSVVSAQEGPTSVATTPVSSVQAVDQGEMGVTAEQKMLVGTVTSSKEPQHWYEFHRTSEDFFINDLPAGTYALEWVVEKGQVEYFDVKEAKFSETDPTRWYGIRPGNWTSTTTKEDERRKVHFYIADPVGATGDFEVKVYAVYP